MLCAASTRASAFKFSLPSPTFSTKTQMESPPRSLQGTVLNSANRFPPRKADVKDFGDDGSVITLQEWQGWGTVSPLPAKVVEIVQDLKLLERNIDARMSFGGSGGKLQGDFKIQEDKKHRATYEALGDSEKKLQFFSARQIACRLLGSRGYLCQKCWLPLEEDCMCSKVKPCSLWHGIRLWLYMHPKDFLRQNNTGKLLWQVFGVQSAILCLYGIADHEEIMWNAFKHAGKDKVWCLYPNKNAVTKSVQDAFGQDISANLECTPALTNEDKSLNFVLIDGTWNNSAAMFRRLKIWKLLLSDGVREDHFLKTLEGPLENLKICPGHYIDFLSLEFFGAWGGMAVEKYSQNAGKFAYMNQRLKMHAFYVKEQTKFIWGEEDLRCISLATGASTMHKLRPQPSWDRTCTAAAAIGLLSELQFLPEFSSYGLDKQTEALEDALVVLLEALTVRRRRMGRSITRKVRHNSNIC